MSEDWAQTTTEQLVGRGWMQPGVCLILGGVETGKTTLAAALAKRLAQDRPVGLIDADIGQSHIGPPATVGWAIVDKPKDDLVHLAPHGFSFVGDVTPVGHLLQFTAALARCAQEVCKITKRFIIDTPGFISGPAASALWWTVQQIVQPKVILAVQRENELGDILSGLRHMVAQLETLKPPPEIPTKSPQTRRSYRLRKFHDYFRDASLYNLRLSAISVRMSHRLASKNPVSRLVALRDDDGEDLAIGIVRDWQSEKDTVIVEAPQLDMSRICCLIVGDVTLDSDGE